MEPVQGPSLIAIWDRQARTLLGGAHPLLFATTQAAQKAMAREIRHRARSNEGHAESALLDLLHVQIEPRTVLERNLGQ